MSKEISFDTDAFTLDWATGVIKDVSARRGHGFRIIADPRDPGVYPVKVWLTGRGNRGRGHVFVTGPEYYKGEFATLSVESLGLSPAGSWFVEVGLNSDSAILPSSVSAAKLPAVVTKETDTYASAANPGDAPSGNTSGGVSLAGAKSVRVRIEPVVAGQFVNAVGAMLALYNPVTVDDGATDWERLPDLDITINDISTANIPGVCSAPRQLPEGMKTGRIIYIPDGGTTTSGAGNMSVITEVFY